MTQRIKLISYDQTLFLECEEPGVLSKSKLGHYFPGATALLAVRNGKHIGYELNHTFIKLNKASFLILSVLKVYDEFNFSSIRRYRQ